MNWMLQALLLIVLAVCGVALLFGIWWLVTRDARNSAPEGTQRSAFADGLDALTARGCRLWVVLLVIAVGFMVVAALSTCGR